MYVYDKFIKLSYEAVVSKISCSRVKLDALSPGAPVAAGQPTAAVDTVDEDFNIIIVKDDKLSVTLDASET